MRVTRTTSAAAGDRAAWKTRLQPWLDALKQARLAIKIPQVVRPTVSDIDDLWLEVEMEADAVNLTSSSLWIMLVEAMEIMELLARVDLTLAWRLLTEYSTSCEEWVKAQPEGIQVLPRFQLTVYADPELSCVEATFKGLTTLGGDGAAHSATYSGVKTSLLANWMEAHHDGQAFDRQRDGYVEVSVHFDLMSHWYAAEGTYDRLQKGIKRISLGPRRGSAIAMQLPGTARTLCPFSIDVAKYRCNAYQPALSARLLSMLSISSMQIPLTGMNMKFFESNKLDETLWRDFVETHIASSRGAGLSRLDFSLEWKTVTDVETLCMAIAHSGSLREIEFGRPKYGGSAGFADIATQSRWLAYALFSGESSHEIHTAKLDLHALDEDSSVDAMRDVLCHADPLAYLFHSKWSEESPVNVRTSASAAIIHPSATLHRGHFGLRITRQGATAVAIDPGISYRVVRNRPEDDFVEILLPRGDVCWVKRSDVLEMRPVVNRETHPVRHLILKNAVQGHVAPAIQLITLLGGPLDRLTLDDFCFDDDEMADFVDALVNHCPNLRQLTLQQGVIETLEPLYSRVTQLEVFRAEEMFVRRPSSWCDFMAVLGNSELALTRSLRELRIMFEHNRSAENKLMRRNIQEACTAMLDKNRWLRRCELLYCERSGDAMWSQQFLAHNGEVLPAKLQPLSQAKTLAFMSVVSVGKSSSKRHKSHHSVSARCKLGVDSLRLILELAATPVSRVCIMTDTRDEF